jgi:tetratricopeptide (TPR) repeat protein
MALSDPGKMPRKRSKQHSRAHQRPTSPPNRATNPAVAWLHGLAAMGDEQWEEALRSLQHFLSLNVTPEDRVQALGNIGACYLAMERYDEALATLDELQRLAPEDQDFAHSRAVTLACAGYLDQASAAFQAFAERWPEEARALEIADQLDLLRASQQGQRPPGAFLVDHLQEQVKHNSEVGDFALVERKARRMIAADPTRPEGHFYLGRACRELDRSEEAVEAFLQARRLKADNGPTLYSLASSYLHLDRPDEALPLLHECLKMDFERPDTLGLLGRAHLQLGDREQAIECWQAALQADPSHTPARWHLYEVGAGPEPATLPLTTKQRELKRLSPVIKARMTRPLVRRCGDIVLTLDPEVGFVLEDGENPGNATIHAGGPFRVYDRVPRTDLLDLIGMLKMLLVLVNNENTRDVAVLAYYAAHPSFNYQVRFERGKVTDAYHDGRFIVDEAPRFFKIRIDSDFATPYGEPMQGKLIYLSQPKGPGFMVSTLGLEDVSDSERSWPRLRG